MPLWLTDPHFVPPTPWLCLFLSDPPSRLKGSDLARISPHPSLPLALSDEPKLGREPPAMVSFLSGLVSPPSTAELLCHQKPFYHREIPLRPLWMGLSPLHCKEHCQVTRWHWKIRPPNISPKAHLLLPLNSLFGCWHREDSVFPELEACQHPPCSPTHPHPEQAAHTADVMCLQPQSPHY